MSGYEGTSSVNAGSDIVDTYAGMGRGRDELKAMFWFISDLPSHHDILGGYFTSYII